MAIGLAALDQSLIDIGRLALLTLDDIESSFLKWFGCIHCSDVAESRHRRLEYTVAQVAECSTLMRLMM